MNSAPSLQCALCAALSTERAAVVQACVVCGSRYFEPASELTPPTPAAPMLGLALCAFSGALVGGLLAWLL